MALDPTHAAIISKFLQNFKPEIKGLSRRAKNELKQFLDDGLKQYLDLHVNRLGRVKTFWHRQNPVDFYKVFFHVRLQYNEDTFITTHHAENIFLKSQFISIVGNAGSGKSMIAKHVFINTLENSNLIPVLIELRSLNKYDNNLEHFLAEKIFENKLSNDSRILERILSKGKFVFILDGFDELYRSKEDSVLSDLKSFITKYSKNRYLITSRPHSGVEYIPSFHTYEIAPLSNEEVTEFIKFSVDEELSKYIIESINKEEKDYVKAFLGNPLLLSLYIFVFKNNSRLPEKRHIYYRRVWDTLFDEHDERTKPKFDRELQTNLPKEDFEKVLKIFSLSTYFEQKFDFDREVAFALLNNIKSSHSSLSFRNEEFISDLKNSITIWLEDEGLFTYIHRSIQEYFTALCIKDLKSNKKVVYEKLAGKIEGRGIIEHWNLLRLCHEMDEYDTNKHLFLPLLKDLDQTLSLKFESDSYKGVISTLFYCIQRNEFENSSYAFLHSSINKFLPMLYDQLNALREILCDIFDQNLNAPGISELYDGPSYEEAFVSLYTTDLTILDNQFYDALNNSEVHQRIDELMQYISNRVKEVEKELAEISKNEIDISNLINN